MLILRRKAGESLVIGEDVKVTVIDINEGSIRLAIEAPREIPILRSELLQAAKANQDAVTSAAAPPQALLEALGGHAAEKSPAGGPAPLRPRHPGPTA